jgi:hypothetical protein
LLLLVLKVKEMMGKIQHGTGCARSNGHPMDTHP